ncbi:unnamed protein product [Schistocephalus solidus]|uniref:PITH domain-containing protein n=1 Tax=Schistocephalus solidus TaxID=70667 RepID=A0A183SPX4_SCHSO|nr:unnamed protein product [Schistocephalus solidus]
MRSASSANEEFPIEEETTKLDPTEPEAVQTVQTSNLAALPTTSPAPDMPKALPVKKLASQNGWNTPDLPPHIDQTNALARTYDQFNQYAQPQFMRSQPQLNYPPFPFCAPQLFYGPWINAENYANPLPVVYEPLNPRQFAIPPFIPGVLGQTFASINSLSLASPLNASLEILIAFRFYRFPKTTTPLFLLAQSLKVVANSLIVGRNASRKIVLDWDWVGDGALTDEVPQATNRVLGQLHIRLANVGYRDASSRRTMRGRQKRSHVIAIGQPGTTPGFFGGSLSTVPQGASVSTQPTKTMVVRARKMVDTYSQLEEQLKIQRGALRGPAESSVGPNCAERERRLAKFRAAKQAALAVQGDRESSHEVPLDRATELDMIDTFRTSVKRENILSMLTGAATLRYALHTSFGSTEFFEFELHNPEGQEDNVQVLIDDTNRSLQLITNAPEIRAFKACYNITTPTDDSIFAFNVPLQSNAAGADASPRRNQADIAICLRPNETVLVPFKYMECSASTVDEFLTLKPKVVRQTLFIPVSYEFQTYTLRTRTICLARVSAIFVFLALLPSFRENSHLLSQVTFKSMRTGKILGQLQLQIYTYPPIIDQTFHFFQPELSYLKRVVRIPPLTQNTGDLPSAGLDAEGRALQKIWTRVSDPGVITESSVVTFGKPIDLLVKVSAGSSPDSVFCLLYFRKIRRFLVAVYLDPSQMKPAYVWYWSIQSLRRVDLVTVLGQPAYAGLLIRGDGGSTSADGGRLLTSRRVGVFSSHPLEVSLGTELGSMPAAGESRTLAFLLNSTSVYELKDSPSSCDLPDFLSTFLLSVAVHFDVLAVNSYTTALVRKWAIAIVRVKPKAIGRRKYQINVVDQATRAVIQSWILCVETKTPDVSRTYDVRIPVYARDGSTGTLNKRLSYTNPYPQAKALRLETSRPDLVQIKESQLNVGVGETAQICLKFNVLPSPTTSNCFVFLTDENEKIEDTFAINIEYF